jgi:type II secretory pathway pseudopilin PulG
MAGFGIIELLVCISIMIVISAVILVQQSAFNSAVLVRSQAYGIALDARQIQLSAVSAIAQNGEFRSLQGLHFDLANNQEYKIFLDADNDRSYDIFGKQGKLDKRFEIRAIRAISNSQPGSTITTVSVVFERPNFDAYFYNNGVEIIASRIEIDIAQKNGQSGTNDVVRTVEITSTGQIAVQ